MATLMNLLLLNQISVLALAVLVWTASRSIWLTHRPALVHALWLLVLLKFVTPPLIGLPLVPAAVWDVVLWEVTSKVPYSAAEDMGPKTQLPSGPSSHWVTSADTTHSLSANSHSASENGISGDSAASQPDRASVIFILGLIGSLLVSLGIIGCACRQALTIDRLLRELPGASSREVNLLKEVSQRLNLKKLPRVLIVDESISPMLWVWFSDAAIVLPCELIKSVSDVQLKQILAHELAHSKRREHLTNMLAFLISSLFWWNPLAWFARRQVHATAETCCDAIAIKSTAASRQDYASTLLEVVEFVSSNKLVSPAAATSFGQLLFLKRRVAMIANSKVQTCLTRRLILLLICAAIALPMIPAIAQQEPESTPSPQLPEIKYGPSDGERSEISEIDDGLKYEITPEAGKAAKVNGKASLSSFKLPDYLPAAHGNMVNIFPDHFFMLHPLGSDRKWHVVFVRDRSGATSGKTFWDAELTIPSATKLKQGDTFQLHLDKDSKTVAYVEADYVNDLDIGVKIMDAKTGEVTYQCTLLRNMSRYQSMADQMSGLNGTVICE